MQGSSASFRGRICAATVLVLWIASAWLLPRSANGDWRAQGPAMGGRISAIVADSAGTTLVVASPGGGVWKRMPGYRWRPSSAGLTDFSVTHLEWDVVNPSRLWAVTRNGLFFSDDLAATWHGVVNPRGQGIGLIPPWNDVKDPKPFAQLALSDSKSVLLYGQGCAGLWYAFSEPGVALEPRQAIPFPDSASSDDNCLGAIAASPRTKRVYFSTLSNARDEARAPGGAAHVFGNTTCAWRADTPCLVWQPTNRGLGTEDDAGKYNFVGALHSPPGASGVELIAAVAVNNTTRAYETPYGDLWDHVGSFVTATTPQPRSLVSRSDGTVYLGDTRSYVSTRGYDPWRRFTSEDEHYDVRAVYLDERLGFLFTGTDGSRDGGRKGNLMRWRTDAAGSRPSHGSAYDVRNLAIWQTYYAGVPPPLSQRARDRRTVFLGSQDNDDLCGELRLDALSTGWSTRGTAPNVGDFFAFQYAPSDPRRVYVIGFTPVLFRGTRHADGCRNTASIFFVRPSVTWEATDLRGNTLNAYGARGALAVDPVNPDRLAIAFLTTVGISLDGGRTVTPVTLPGGEHPTCVYIDRFGSILVGTNGGGILRSTAGGAFEAFGLQAEAPVAVLSIQSSQRGLEEVYWAATTDGLYRRVIDVDPTGTDWHLLPVAANDSPVVSDVAIDPRCGDRVYAALGYAGPAARHPGGVQFSADGGDHWVSITAGQPVHYSPITDIELDPLESRYAYVATYGQGMFLYDWGPGRIPGCAPR